MWPPRDMGGWLGVIMYCARHRKEWCQAGRPPIPQEVLMHSNAMQKCRILKLYYTSQISQRSLACGTKCTFCEISGQRRVFKPLDLRWCEIVLAEERVKKMLKSRNRVGTLVGAGLELANFQLSPLVCRVPTMAMVGCSSYHFKSFANLILLKAHLFLCFFSLPSTDNWACWMWI